MYEVKKNSYSLKQHYFSRISAIFYAFLKHRQRHNFYSKRVQQLQISSFSMFLLISSRFIEIHRKEKFCMRKCRGFYVLLRYIIAILLIFMQIFPKELGALCKQNYIKSTKDLQFERLQKSSCVTGLQIWNFQDFLIFHVPYVGPTSTVFNVKNSTLNVSKSHVS